MKKTTYIYRHLARVLIEAETPLSIHSGESDIQTDALVVTDINGLPYIPGSSLAGVLRHSIAGDEELDVLFGFQKGSTGHGSQLIISDAVMIGKEGKAMDGIQLIDPHDAFYSHFLSMPIRQHVRITETGTADDKGKFDGQITFKGTRFVFEMELISSKNEEDAFNKLLSQMQSKDFRIGSGTRNGFGRIKCVSIKEKALDLEKDLSLYLSKSSDLSKEWEGYEPDTHSLVPSQDKWEEFDIHLCAEDFFLFGSGLSDDEADMTPVSEDYIEWDNEKPVFKSGTVIPASSIKGALSHRTAFYWNKLNELFVDDKKGLTADQNEAVAAIFGKAGEGMNSQSITRGNILIDDIFIPVVEPKLLNHVSIDRFTGGALDGALFSEKASYGSGLNIELHIIVKKSALDESDSIRKAFESALDDLRKGMLPLGGGTNRGHGIFTTH